MPRFSPATQAWFDGAFAAATPAQEGAWDATARGEHTLVVAPTGSGKTLAAFLSSLDRLAALPPPEDPLRRCRVLYVSPLKALAVDVERNLRSPLAGIRQAAVRLGLPQPAIDVAIRSGDTPADERRLFARRPPDILITTPESLFLLLTSAAREALRGVDTVVVDEVHAVCATKRGAHLALSLERLDALLETPAQRIGLSATVRPVDEVATFLAGGRAVTVVQPPAAKTFELEVVVPVEDMSALGEPTGDLSGAAAGAERRASIWPHVEERVLDLVEAHRSTIVFANSRRLAERLTARLNELAEERAEAVAGESADRPSAAPPGSPPAAPPAQLMGQSGAGVPARGDRVVARAHHGSVSREQRVLVEEDLKAGRLPAVVATSSLELGIDMGAVDLVVQVESPPSVASGLQRVGRAGHQVGAVSRGVIFPKYRGDLLECAVVAERMREGAIESMRYPRNPLDVLAQQVVAMVAMDPQTVDGVEELVRRAAPFAGLPRSALEAVLDMLAGRYPSDAFAELRPRLVWDRITGELTARRSAQRLAVTSGGTIPDRGLFGVFLASGEGPGRRVGELDEEMVYESRVGDVFLLGSTSWRIEDITHDRVLVSPAPGEIGRMPFWKGDSPGRPVEFGTGARGVPARGGRRAARERRWPGRGRRASTSGARRTSSTTSPSSARPRGTCPTTGRCSSSGSATSSVTGAWSCTRRSGRRSTRRGRSRWARGCASGTASRSQTMHSDDGIVLRLPDTDADPPGAELAVFDPDDVEAVVTGELGGSALFAARFRECAARSLLLPKRDPRRRAPLWQQRQRANQLLQVASEYGTFPVVLEAMRECLQDVFDVPGLSSLMRDLANRSVRLVEVETPTASPFARSLLFGYVGMFLYEGDAPLAERRAQALSLDTGLLAELLGSTELRELLDADALAAVEAELQRLPADRHARGPDSVHDLLRGLGDLSTAEALARGATAQDLAELEAGRRAIRVRLAGDERWLAIEDAGRVRDALGTALPVGVPEAFTEPVRDPLGDLVARYARTHGPFRPEDVAGRLGLGVAVVATTLERLRATGRVVQGEFRPGEVGTEWCDAEVLRAIRRRSLAALRQEIEPVPAEALARFTPAWQGIGVRPSSGVDAVLRTAEQLAGAPLPASALESMVLPSRVADYTPGMLDELTAAGELVWCGAGALGNADGWVVLSPADGADLLLPPPTDPPGSPLAAAVLEQVADDAALFFRAIADRVRRDPAFGAVTDAELTVTLWELVWSGWLTNDTLAPVRALLGGRPAARRAPRGTRAPRARYGRVGRYGAAALTGGGTGGTGGTVGTAGRATGMDPAVGGRWSRLPAREADTTRRAVATAEVLLDRYGVVTRGAVVAERVPGGFSAVYPVLKAAEESGRARRGYFVDGLGAAQFATPGAVDRLRGPGPRGPAAGPRHRPGGDRPGQPLRGRSAVAGVLDLAATPPSPPASAGQPSDGPGGVVPQDLQAGAPAGPGDPVPATRRGHQPARKAGALVVLVDGACTLYVERGGRTLLSFTDDPSSCSPPRTRWRSPCGTACWASSRSSAPTVSPSWRPRSGRRWPRRGSGRRRAGCGCAPDPSRRRGTQRQPGTDVETLRDQVRNRSASASSATPRSRKLRPTRTPSRHHCGVPVDDEDDPGGHAEQADEDRPDPLRAGDAAEQQVAETGDDQPQGAGQHDRPGTPPGVEQHEHTDDQRQCAQDDGPRPGQAERAQPDAERDGRHAGDDQQDAEQDREHHHGLAGPGQREDADHHVEDAEDGEQPPCPDQEAGGGRLVRAPPQPAAPDPRRLRRAADPRRAAAPASPAPATVRRTVLRSAGARSRRHRSGAAGRTAPRMVGVPEGDTVWLTARRLDTALRGRQVTTFDLRVPQLAVADLRGDTVSEVRARGKHVLMRFAGGRTLHSHLRMDGSWYLSPTGTRPRRHPEHMVRALVGNAEWLATGYRVHDLAIAPTSEEDRWVGHLGPDLLGPDWDPAEAVRRMRADPHRAIGDALLDQRTLAGIGNMYKAEVLFVERVNPWTSVAELTDDQLDRLAASSYRLLRANRGHPEQTTTGLIGRGKEHWVYGRLGEACLRCGTPVNRADQGEPPQQRITYWCPRCQPGPVPPGTRSRRRGR